MFKALSDSANLSARALNVGIFSLVTALILSMIDGYLHGLARFDWATQPTISPATLGMLTAFIFDVRNLAENIIWAAAVVFIGAKFLENRTTISVGFDKLDASKVSFRGPDDTNTVWVGHRYGSKLEAETVAMAIENRLKESS
ncbi:MAG TPA: hypothetical protein VIM56_15245 [Rhizomicrobium sp.]